MLLTHRLSRVLHSLDPLSTLYTAWPDSLCPALLEEPSHAGLIGEVELAGIPVVGQLEGHLNEGIRGDAALLHEALAVLPEHDQAQVYVTQQGLCHLWVREVNT